MLIAERLAARLQRLAEKRLRAVEVTLCLQQRAQVGNGGERVGMAEAGRG